jgi:hypothetical protein
MLSLAKEWMQPAFYFVAVVATIGSAWTYYRNSRRERAKWLFDLFQHFYEGDEHKQIRKLIESGETQFAIKEDDDELLQRLDNYLNFFEFLDFLNSENILTKDDVSKLFDYPLRRIDQDPAIRKYALRKEYGYEGIKHLFDILSYPEVDESQG